MWIRASLSLMLLLLVSTATPAFNQENTSGDSTVPLVYNVENTGANFAAPTFPSFAQLPIIRPLPDPFLFANGTRDTSFSNWEQRRNEIKASVEKFEIGPKPDCHDCTITANYVPAAAGSAAGSLTVRVTRNGKSLTLNERVWLAQGMGDGPFPVVIPMSLAFPPFFVPPVPNYGSLPSTAFAGRPIATIDFFHNDVTVYSFFGVSSHVSDPFYQLYPELCAGNGKCGQSGTGPSNSGQYAAWSWGVSRLIDGIEIATHQANNPLPIDIKHIAVTGCSYAGKMALFAGAFDERVALTIAQENGGGGAPSWRVTDEIEEGGASEDIQRTDYNWFAGQMKDFSGVNRYKLPTDHHELMAMVAPRALLETGNTDFYWLSNRSNYISARATQRVYNAFGIGDRFGFYIDGGHNHCATLRAESPAVAAYLDKFLLDKGTVNTDVEVFPTNPPLKYDYTNLDYARWTAWWGSNDPKFPNNWNPGDGSMVMSMNRPLDINSGDSLLAGYDLFIDNTHPAATVSLTGASVTTDVSCPDSSSYTLAIPVTNGTNAQTYSIPTNNNDWFPSPNQKSLLVYQGSAPATAQAPAVACAGGAAKSFYFSALGVEPPGASVGTPPVNPGFATTDPANPPNVRFHCSDSTTGDGGSWSATVTVNY
jgi:hypothetical protein